VGAALRAHFSFVRSPPKLPPDEVFGLLLQTPRPVTPIEYRLPGAEAFELSVQALSTIEVHRAFESQEPLIDMAAAAVLVQGRRAFASRAHMDAVLDESEAIELGRQVAEGLATFPVRGFSREREWIAYLVDGASAAHHSHTARVLAACFDGVTGAHRPDIFFGLPLGQLSCCHWFAFWAARSMT
jgi:hypothetical protein